jgi:Poxvirus Late Transcription Factor VLTF3 like
MSDGAFFKVKTSKRSNPEARTTLDAIHQQKVQTMLDDQKQVEQYKQDLSKLRSAIQETTSDIERWRLERDAGQLEKKIKTIENGTELMDYFLRTGDILSQYYEVQDQIQQGGTTTYRSNKAKPGSILALLEEVAQEEKRSQDRGATTITEKRDEKPKEETPGLHRNHLLNEYLQLEDPSMVRSSADIYDDPWTICSKCNSEMIMCMNEANLTCSKCGYQEFILVDSDKPSYKDPPREVSYYAYKKINHFNEWLAQFQAKESTEIPQEIYDEILIQLKKERITNMGSLKPTKLREILRKMKCSKYYEHIPHIINRLNGQNAPFMSRDDEEKLRHMFREIQPSFKKHCPKGRRNFLSYGYVLYKFCELLEMDEYLACFPLLKNRDKLYLQDKTWELICKDMGWQYVRTTL